MIPKIRRADSDRSRPRSAFSRTGAARPLEVWLDPRALSDAGVGLFVGFAGHEFVSVYSTADVPGVQRVETVAHGESDTAGVKWVDGSTTSMQRGGLLGAAQRRASRVGADRNVDPGSLLETAILADVARTRRADAFVSDAVGLTVAAIGANGMLVGEVLSLIGLFMRNLDEYFVPGEQTVRYDRSAFWWLMSRELLPSWGPTWRELGDRADGGRHPHTNGLGFAPLQRVGHALRARDRVHVELQGQPKGGSAEEAAHAFDVLVLCLDAGFDACARVLNSHLDIGKDEAARWRGKGFRQKVASKLPALEPLLAAGGQVKDALRLLGALRRTLHGAPAQPVGYDNRADERDSTRIVVTMDTITEIEPVV